MFEQEWHQLLIPTMDGPAAADALRSALQAQGYKAYDPFPGGTGLSFGWKRQVRLFVTPPAGGWTRVLGAPDVDALPAVAGALNTAILYAWLTADDSGVAVWTAAGSGDLPDALADWRRADCSPDDLVRALAGNRPVAELPAEGPAMLAVPLPPDMQDMADQVDAGQAEKMMDRLSKSVFGKLGAGGAQAQADAQAALAGQSPWNTDHGRRLRGIMDCLTVPAGWRTPTHADVREAYQIARSRQVNPDGLRLPGDDDSLAAVPDALDYQPVYAGIR
jgi:hypothetical protein